MHDKVIGLVGFGFIGSLVAKKLSGFDVKVVVYDPYTDPERIKAAAASPSVWKSCSKPPTSSRSTPG